MAESEEVLFALFTELDAAIGAEDFPRAVSVADKILAISKNDKDALKSKVVALLNQNLFAEAVDAVRAAGASKDLVYEEAYALFRLFRLEEALKVATAAPPTPHLKELEAQILYRLERFPEAIKIYNDLLASDDDDFQTERTANLAACYAAAATVDQHARVDWSSFPQQCDTYELEYNNACLALARADVDGALSHLEKAAVLCRQTLLEDDPDMTEEEIEMELSLIKVQQGYAFQLKGQEQAALELYNKILKTKHDDAVLMAIASNNVIAINKEHDVFDSKKKMKAATLETLVNKLTVTQKHAIDLNQCLLLLHMNQAEACRRQAQKIATTYPGSEWPYLMEAATYWKEKRQADCLATLAKYANTHAGAYQCRLALVQSHIANGELSQALDALLEVKPLCFKPAFVSLQVTLSTASKPKAYISKLFQQAIEYWSQSKEPQASTFLAELCRVSGEFNMANGLYTEAAKNYELLWSADQSNAHALAQLITALSRCNLKQAEQYILRIPAPSFAETAALDVDALEASTGLRVPRRQVREEGAEATKETAALNIQKRKRRKRRGKLPKNYNPKVAPDPERWLPKRERTANKKGKKQRYATSASVAVGTQGSSSGNSADVDYSNKPVKSTASQSPSAKPLPANIKSRKGRK